MQTVRTQTHTHFDTHSDIVTQLSHDTTQNHCFSFFSFGQQIRVCTCQISLSLSHTHLLIKIINFFPFHIYIIFVVAIKQCLSVPNNHQIITIIHHHKPYPPLSLFKCNDSSASKTNTYIVQGIQFSWNFGGGGREKKELK